MMTLAFYLAAWASVAIGQDREEPAPEPEPPSAEELGDKLEQLIDALEAEIDGETEDGVRVEHYAADDTGIAPVLDDSCSVEEAGPVVEEPES